MNCNNYRSLLNTEADTGGGLADPMTTRGDMIVRDSSNTTARLPVGTSGQVLTSDGTDASWTTPASASGALNLLYSATIAGTTQVNNVFTGTYDTYKLEIVVDTVSAGATEMTWSTGGVSAVTGYRQTSIQIGNTGVPANYNSGSTKTAIFYCDNAGNSATFTVNSPFLSTRTCATWQAMHYANKLVSGGTVLDNIISYDGFKFGNASLVCTGTIRVYGVSK